MPENSHVTTVVATRDRREGLLRSLPHHASPLIVVDNGSTDGSLEAIRDTRPDARVVALGRNRGAVARTVGVEAAQTPFVAFADDDSWWAPGALDTAARLMQENPRWAVLAGTILVGDQERLDPVCAEMRTSDLPELDDRGHRLVTGFIACGAVVRRSAYLAAGGFDDVVFFAGEEERLTLDLLASGWQLVHAPEVVAYHHPDSVDGRGRRADLLARNRILTAVMRRPWPVVMGRTVDALRRRQPRALAAAALRTPAALRQRQVVPERVERLLSAAARTPDEASGTRTRAR